MIEEFIKSAGGPGPAATILGVSGTIVHRWRRQGPSDKAARRMGLWLAYNVEHERFILRNVWAREDRLWTPTLADFHEWLSREFNILTARVGHERALALWNEVTA